MRPWASAPQHEAWSCQLTKVVGKPTHTGTPGQTRGMGGQGGREGHEGSSRSEAGEAELPRLTRD